MMKIDQALHILRCRRAMAILYMVIVAGWLLFSTRYIDLWMAEDFPQLSGFLLGTSIVCNILIELLLFYWICRLCAGIWWLSGIRRREKLQVYCPVTFRVRFKNGGYDFL